MSQLAQLFDEALAAETANVRKHVRDRARLACREGCNACCHIPLAVTALEAIAVAAAVRSDAPLVAHVRLAGPVVDLAGPARRWQQRIACALLQEGRCAAYAARPLPCRSYSSFDAGRCDDALQRGDRDAQLTVPLWTLPHAFAATIRNAIRSACAAEGLEDAHVELSGAVTAILSDSGRVSRWLSGERVFAANRP